MSNVRALSLVTSILLLSFLACDSDEPLAPQLELRSAASGPAVNAPSGTNAAAVSWSQINIGWQDNSSNETGFEVHRSITGPGGTFTLLASPGADVASLSDGGLSGSTQYCYEVRAFKTTGNKKNYSAFSNVSCATTLAAPVPAAPSAVNPAPRFNGYAINVTWTDNSTNETGFRVERSATDTGPWTSVGTAGPNTTSLDDSQVPAAEQPACYRVFAVNSYGDSGPSNVDCTAVPVGPTNLVATAQSDGSVDLSWIDISAIEDGFAMYRWTASGSFDRVAALPANATSYHDPWVGDSTYYYRVYATKDGGTSAGSNTVSVSVSTIPPAALTNLEAVPQTSSMVVAYWVDASANEAGFRVERSIDGGATWVTAASTGPDETALGDAGLPSEQPVCYRAIAFNVKGESPPSNIDCTTPPAAPTGFTGTVVDSQTVDFAWTDNSAVEDGYLIGIDYGYGYWEFVAGVGPNTTSFRLEGYPYAMYQTYFVVATKDGGYSDWSNSVYAAPPGSSSLRAGSTSRVPATRALAPRRPTGKRGKP